MLCDIIKAFPFSRNGTTPETAVAGGACDIPDALVPGLAREGFLRVSGGGAGYENRMAAAAPEIGAPVQLTDREINADLEASGVEFDPRGSAEDRMAQRDEARTADAYPGLSPAQEASLDRDGDRKPGGSPKGGNRKKAG